MCWLPRARFWPLTVTLSQLTPGLAAGGTFAFAESMDNFAIATFLANLSFTTLPVEAYSHICDIDDPTVATTLILFSVFLVFLTEWLPRLDRFLDRR
ncbi:MAG: hypothetical protein LCH61_16505 [Proteobacteria bacterium]|nr:hypothetical protein [Pseudomonadota bacterium]